VGATDSVGEEATSKSRISWCNLMVALKLHHAAVVVALLLASIFMYLSPGLNDDGSLRFNYDHGLGNETPIKSGQTLFFEEFPGFGENFTASVVSVQAKSKHHEPNVTLSTFQNGVVKVPLKLVESLHWKSAAVDPWEVDETGTSPSTAGTTITHKEDGKNNKASCSCSSLQRTEEIFMPGFNTSILKSHFQHATNRMRIYIYPVTQLGGSIQWDLHSWIDSLQFNDNGFDGCLVFIRGLINSEMYTTNASEATFFLVPDWENIIYGMDNETAKDQIGMVDPLVKAISSDVYRNASMRQCSDAGSCRNHIVVYSYDYTPRCEPRLASSRAVLQAIDSRFISIQFSGRLDDWGAAHSSQFVLGGGCYRPEHEIVIPSMVPGFVPNSKSNCKDGRPTFFFHGDFHFRKGHIVSAKEEPDLRKTERRAFLTFFEAKGLSRTEGMVKGGNYGLSPAGVGTWSARFLFNLRQCSVPILSTDGIILPFERYLNYEAFTSKLLHRTYTNDTWKKDGRTPKQIRAFQNAILTAERCQKKCSLAKQRGDTLLLKKQDRAQVAFPWLNWHSGDPLVNPFTLTTIELVCFSSAPRNVPPYCNLPRSRVAKKEYWP